ncbi:hypothetical protein HK097_009889 [Rhizophlyctis rosea]|uniref:Uncharacterized protein n=1 Tax=Rhizophlyctis rosea TaxID=64517 RepID=A0AAD5X3H1_9FUNG|nr:hypothetical protein HK097_009889 [Rhizophlyctis rosea]
MLIRQAVWLIPSCSPQALTISFPSRTLQVRQLRPHIPVPVVPYLAYHSTTLLLAPLLSRSPEKWTTEENFRLLEALESGKDWEAIASEFPNRTLEAVQNKFTRIREDHTAKNRGSWTESQTRLLVKLHKKGTPTRKIATQLNRTCQGVRFKLSDLLATNRGALDKSEKRAIQREVSRAAKAGEVPRYSWLATRLGHYVGKIRYYALRIGAKKGRWSVQEDTRLTRIVKKLGESVRWAEIARKMGGRTSNQCFKRWSWHINPEFVKVARWTGEMDESLMELFGRGLTTKEVAKKMGNLRPDTVRSRLRTLKNRAVKIESVE